jgi:hypothetical protein
VNYYTQSDSLVADNKNLPNSTFSDYDTAFTLGGPLIEDSLWFFTSLQRKEREEDVIDPNTGALLRTVTTTQDLGFAKLTWQPTDTDKFIAEFFNDPFERDGSDDYTVTANRDRARLQGGDNYKLSYSRLWDKAQLTFDWASHEGEISSTAADSTTRNDVAFSGVTVANTDTDLGGYGSSNVQFRNKDSLGLTFDYFLEGRRGTHEIRTGFSSIRNERTLDLVYTGDGAQYTSIGNVNSGTSLADYTSGTWTGERDLSEDDYQRMIDGMAASSDAAYFLGLLDADSSGAIDLMEMSALAFNSTAGNPNGAVNVYRIAQTETALLSFKTEGDVFFIQDDWNIDEHWTVNFGIRAEKWDHIATDGSTVFTFDWEVAPRLSVIYDIKGDGQSKVWGYAGRYFDPIRTDMTAFAGTLSGSVRDEQVFVGNQWVTFRTRGGAQVQDGFFAPTTETPYTDEFMLGYERALSSDMSISATYTNRTTKDILEDYDLGFYSDPAAVGGYALPLSYFGFDTLPSANYFIATLAGGKRDYDGVEVTFRKRRSPDSRWQALASYAYNDASGNTNSDGNADLQGDFLYLDPRAPNVYGPQPGNIEHLFKLHGTYTWDNGFEVGAVYHWNSGLLYSETFSQYSRHTPIRVDTAYESNGATSRWLAPGTVGTHKTDSFGTLDVRAKYTLDISGGRYAAEFFLDIFNLLDDQAATRDQELSGGDGVFLFGQSNAWVAPRRLYLGARLNF